MQQQELNYQSTYDGGGLEVAMSVRREPRRYSEYLGSDEIDSYSRTSLLDNNRPSERKSARIKRENGDELGKIDLVLRQLQTASRSHRMLLEERYNELTSGMRPALLERQERARRTRMNFTPRKVDRQRLVDYLTSSRLLELDSSDQELQELSWLGPERNRANYVYRVH